MGEPPSKPDEVPTFAEGAATFSEEAPTFSEGAPTFSGEAPTFSEVTPTFVEGGPTFADGPTFAEGDSTFAAVTVADASAAALVLRSGERLDRYVRSLMEHDTESTERDIAWLDRLIEEETS